MSDLVWHGDQALIHVHRAAAGWLSRAAITVSRRAKVLLSVSGTMVRTRGDGRGRKGSRIYGAVRSKPGEPPRKQYGRLRQSVTYEVDQDALTARVGTNVPYGRYLELGTKRGILPRPWLRRALAESMGAIQGFLAQMGT